MEKPPRSSKKILKILLLGVGLPLFLVISSLSAVFILTLRDPVQFLPKAAVFRVTSLTTLAHQLSGYQAADLIFADPEYAALAPLLSRLREESFGPETLGHSLFLSPADLVESPAGVWGAAVDLGPWSLITRLLPWTPDVLLPAGLTRVSSPAPALFSYPTPSGSSLVLLFRDNLVFFSYNQEFFADFPSDPLMDRVIPLPVPTEGLAFRIPVAALLNEIGPGHPWTSEVLKSQPWNPEAVGVLNLNDRSFQLQVRAELLPGTPTPELPGLGWPSWFGAKGIWPFFTGKVTGVQVTHLPSPAAWAGTEMGVLTHTGSSAPLGFVKIQNPQALEGQSPLKSLEGTAFFTALGVDPQKSQFQVWEDYLFFSQRAEDLKTLPVEQQGSLILTPEFSFLQYPPSWDHPFMAYYDAEKHQPYYLQGQGILSQVARLYGRGVVKVTSQGGAWRLEVSSIKNKTGLVRLLPGYPRPGPQEALVEPDADLKNRFGLEVTVKSPGEILLQTSEGVSLPGWPVKAQGVPKVGPVLTKLGLEPGVAYLTTAGELVVLNLLGEPTDYSPLPPPATNPFLLQSLRRGDQEVLLIAGEALAVVSPPDGKVLHTSPLSFPGTKALTFDADRDGSEEIYLYGGSNELFALGPNLEPLPEFPVIGRSKPRFADLGGDGFLELSTTDDQGREYVYTLRY